MSKAAKSKPKAAFENVLGASAAARDAALLKASGSSWNWHYGTIRVMGIYAGGARAVDMIWDEGLQSNGGDAISDEAWEILKLAFKTSRRIRTLSGLPGPDWAFDFEQVQAVSP